MGTSRLHVVHTTAFRYTRPVSASYNEARMTPLAQPGQTVLDARLDVQPHTWAHDYRDYWGSAVTAFEVLAPHEQLVVTAESRVEVADRPGPRTAGEWATLRSPALRDTLAEFLSDTPTTLAPDEALAGRRPGGAAGLAPRSKEPSDLASRLVLARSLRYCSNTSSKRCGRCRGRVDLGPGRARGR